MKKTTVINFFGGPGLGKSSSSAELFAYMKSKRMSCELVRELVKKWVYEGRTVGLLDQLYLSALQSREESILYGKVDYVITDSPILLAGVYEEMYVGEQIVMPTLLKFIDFSSRKFGVEHINLFLSRNKPYDQNGRWHNEEEAKEVDVKVREFLDKNNISYINLDCPDEQRIEQVMKVLNV